MIQPANNATSAIVRNASASTMWTRSSGGSRRFDGRPSTPMRSGMRLGADGYRLATCHIRSSVAATAIPYAMGRITMQCTGLRRAGLHGRREGEAGELPRCGARALDVLDARPRRRVREKLRHERSDGAGGAFRVDLDALAGAPVADGPGARVASGDLQHRVAEPDALHDPAHHHDRSRHSATFRVGR